MNYVNHAFHVSCLFYLISVKESAKITQAETTVRTALNIKFPARLVFDLKKPLSHVLRQRPIDKNHGFIYILLQIPRKPLLYSH